MYFDGGGDNDDLMFVAFFVKYSSTLCKNPRVSNDIFCLRKSSIFIHLIDPISGPRTRVRGLTGMIITKKKPFEHENMSFVSSSVSVTPVSSRNSLNAHSAGVSTPLTDPFGNPQY
jgi:hypothetical protein